MCVRTAKGKFCQSEQSIVPACLLGRSRLLRLSSQLGGGGLCHPLGAMAVDLPGIKTRDKKLNPFLAKRLHNVPLLSEKRIPRHAFPTGLAVIVFFVSSLAAARGSAVVVLDRGGVGRWLLVRWSWVVVCSA